VDLVYQTFVRHAGVKVLFLHSGLAELLTYADLVRALPNTMMDLSCTLMKYRGSSLDIDFRYLFSNLDRRCTLGSDFPESTPSDVRSRVIELGYDLPQVKLENVCWKNLARFLGELEGAEGSELQGFISEPLSLPE
jgi:predicted TIM-barrel fold metal-dependent hydrolase